MNPGFSTEVFLCITLFLIFLRRDLTVGQVVILTFFISQDPLDFSTENKYKALNKRKLCSPPCLFSRLGTTIFILTSASEARDLSSFRQSFT